MDIGIYGILVYETAPGDWLSNGPSKVACDRIGPFGSREEFGHWLESNGFNRDGVAGTHSRKTPAKITVKTGGEEKTYRCPYECWVNELPPQPHTPPSEITIEPL
jgi:hypothetical protein